MHLVIINKARFMNAVKLEHIKALARLLNFQGCDAPQATSKAESFA